MPAGSAALVFLLGCMSYLWNGITVSPCAAGHVCIYIYTIVYSILVLYSLVY